MSFLRSVLLAALGITLMAIFAYSVRLGDSLPRRQQADNMRVRLPLPLQVLSASGDRFLAANVDVFRAEMVGAGKLDEETMHVLGAVQVDAANLNPYHEDNYNLAAGVLAWGGEIESSIDVLTKATRSRATDPMPPFYLGFIHQYFLGDFATGARWAAVAADRSVGGNRDFFHALVVKWDSQVADPHEAIVVLRALAAQSRDKSYQEYIALRIGRVKGLIALRDADQAYRRAKGTPPRQLSDLIGYAGLNQIPNDPTGIGYQLDAKGMPSFVFASVQAHPL